MYKNNKSIRVNLFFSRKNKFNLTLNIIVPIFYKDLLDFYLIIKSHKKENLNSP